MKPQPISNQLPHHRGTPLPVLHDSLPEEVKEFMLLNHQPCKPVLEDVIRKVTLLRKLTKETGFYTTKSVGMLLAHLSPDDLCAMAERLELTPREMPR
jgi:hypothetical protein